MATADLEENEITLVSIHNDEAEMAGELPAVEETPPVKPEPEKVEAEKRLTEIEEAEELAAEAEREYLRAKASAKELKEAYEDRVHSLRAIIRAYRNDANRPLLHQKVEVEISAKPDNSWRDLLIAELKVSESIITKLNEAGIENLGQLQDYSASNDGLNGIKGIGSAAREKVSEAFDQFWADHPEYCGATPAVLGESIASDEGEED